MSQKCVVAVFETIPKGLIGWEVLYKAGHGTERVSFLSGDESPELFGLQAVDAPPNDNSPSNTTNSAVGTATGLGAGVGGVMAAPIAIGSMVFPLFVVGPMLGAGLGAIMGGLFDAKKVDDLEEAEPSYTDHLREGGAILIVTGTDHELDKAKASLQTCGPISLVTSELDEE